MRDAQSDDDDDDASQVLDGLGDNDLDGHGKSPASPLDDEELGSEEDHNLDAPLDEDPDALLFNDTFEGV
jgi:hypothetical protein